MIDEMVLLCALRRQAAFDVTWIPRNQEAGRFLVSN